MPETEERSAGEQRYIYRSAAWNDAYDSFPLTLAWLDSGFSAGEHAGIQLSVQLDNDDIASLSAGIAGPNRPMRDDSLIYPLCASKPMLAAAIIRAMEGGALSLSNRVSSYIPELRNGVAGNLTFLQCLAHAVDGVDLRVEPSSESMMTSLPAAVLVILRRLRMYGESWRAPANYLTWPYTLMAAALENATQTPVSRFMEDEVFIPLGMKNSHLGMSTDAVASYRARDSLVTLYNCDSRTAAEPIPGFGDDSPTLELAIPSMGVRTTTADIVRFYGALLAARAGDARSWLSESSALMMTARHRAGIPEESGAMIDFGLGVELESRHYDKLWMSFGPSCDLATFGHKGQSCFMSFADPRWKLKVAIFINGTIMGMAHGRRVFTFAQKLYQDLGLLP